MSDLCRSSFRKSFSQYSKCLHPSADEELAKPLPELPAEQPIEGEVKMEDATTADVKEDNEGRNGTRNGDADADGTDGIE